MLTVSTMTIVAYSDGELRADIGEYTLPVIPDTIIRTPGSGLVSAKEPGATGAVKRPGTQEPERVSFEFVVDSTGVAPGVASVGDEIERFRNLAFTYDGRVHSPNYLKLCLDDQEFTGTLSTLSVAYELFSPTGQPLRAKLSVTFHQHRTPQALARGAEKTSVDLTRVQPVTELPRRR